jgi:hypothetical protein
MTTLFKFIHKRHNQHDDIDNHARKYVESVETSNSEKVIGKVG